MSLENTALLDVDWPDGSENIGGTAEKFWFAPKSHFAKGGIPEVSAAPASIADAATVNGSGFVFKTGRGWNTMHVITDTGGINCEPQGERSGKSFLNKYAYIHPGNKAAALGFCRYANNTSMIMVVQEADGTFRQMGSELFGVTFDVINPTTGNATAERKQISVECSYPSVSPAPIITNYDPKGDEVSASTSSSATGA